MNVETETQTKAVGDIPEPIVPRDLAPPFCGPWEWNKSYPPAGFWSHYRHYDNRGELVLQVGRRCGTGRAKASSSYSRWGTGCEPRIYDVRFEPVSLSRRPPGTVNLRAFVQINWNRPIRIDLTGRTQYLAIQAWGWHRFRAGIEVELHSNATYGEAIVKIADVNQRPIHGAARTTGRSPASDTGPSLEEVQQQLAAAEEGKVEVLKLGSFEQVVTEGGEIYEGTD